ncbi:MAG: TIGR02300 family protein [Pseudomonadota bacterium]
MADALALDPRGLKRICTNCGTRFYDFNKRPIDCPVCSTEFTGEIKVKTRRSRGAPVDDDAPVIETADEIEDTDTLKPGNPDLDADLGDDMDDSDGADLNDDTALEDMDDLADDDADALPTDIADEDTDK